MTRATSKVAITGMGAVTPLGSTVEEFWRNCLQGRDAVGPITRFDASRFPVQLACEVRDWDSRKYSVLERRASRASAFALAAAREALEDSRLNVEATNRERIGVIVGNATGDVQPIADQMERFLELGDFRCDAVAGLRVLPYSIAVVLSVAFGLRGHLSTTVCACSAGTQAIGEAARVIARGDADVMLAGGSEAWLHPIPLASFFALGVISGGASPLSAMCRPFDGRRDGFVPGEGAAILVLESMSHATRRGAHVYGEIAGYAVTADGSHLITPDPSGTQAARCIRLALNDAGLEPDKVDFINAHATATRVGDVSETRAIKMALGDHAYKIPIEATKSMIGHLLGASGAVETVACVKTLETGLVHPTANFEVRDPDCDLDNVHEGVRHIYPRAALKNSFALGGQNVSLILKAAQR